MSCLTICIRAFFVIILSFSYVLLFSLSLSYTLTLFFSLSLSISLSIYLYLYLYLYIYIVVIAGIVLSLSLSLSLSCIHWFDLIQFNLILFDTHSLFLSLSCSIISLSLFTLMHIYMNSLSPYRPSILF